MYSGYSYYEMGHDEGYSNGHSQIRQTPEILAEDLDPPLNDDQKDSFIKGYNDGLKEAECAHYQAQQKDRSDFIRER